VRGSEQLAGFVRDLEPYRSHPVVRDFTERAGDGHKHWRVSAPVVDAPLPRHRSSREAASAQPVLFEADLTPGDCLYLPRGFVHAATAQQGVSLHITVGVHAVTAHDVLTVVVARAGEHPAFRASLPAGFASPGDGSKALVGAVEACLAEALAWLPGVDASAIAEGLRQRFWAQRLPVLEGQLLQLADLDRLDDDAVVGRRPGSICELDVGGADAKLIRLLLGDRVLVVPRALEVALRRLLDGSLRPVSALADLLDAPSRLVLVRRLVREGVVEVSRGY